MYLKIGQTDATLRQIYGTITGLDGVTRVTTKAAEAVRKIINGVDSGAWTATLVHVGGGEYYVRLTQAEIDANAEGTILSWGYKAADTAEAVVDRMQVLAKLPSDVNTIVTRIAGLVLENHVEDDIVRDTNGAKTSSKIYIYDSAANAALHDKATGLIGRYAVGVTYTAQQMSRFAVTREI